jgi:mono/diheme cytochrome c family protein
MRSTTLRLALFLGLIPLAASAQQVDFARDVQPIFERSCSRCHGATQQSGQLRLDS